MKEKHLAMKKIGSALGLGILLFFAVSVESKAQGLEKALITHSSESISITPLIYGIEKGFYRKEGVDLQFRILRGDLAVTESRKVFTGRKGLISSLGSYEVI